MAEVEVKKNWNLRNYVRTRRSAMLEAAVQAEYPAEAEGEFLESCSASFSRAQIFVNRNPLVATSRIKKVTTTLYNT